MKLLKSHELNVPEAGVLSIDNTADVLNIELTGVERIDLHFPKFTDGRAFTQAVALRRRRGFSGAIRAHGDVLVDQLLQMQRCGFSEAVLREDQNLEVGERLLKQFSGFYQGDVAGHAPRFVSAS